MNDCLEDAIRQAEIVVEEARREATEEPSGRSELGDQRAEDADAAAMDLTIQKLM